MIWAQHAVRDAAGRLQTDARDLSRRYRAGEVRHEPDFTSRLLERWQASMEGFESHGVAWSARVLTDRGPNAEERLYGADFAAVVRFRHPDYEIDKGFVAQSKRHEGGDMSKREWARLVGQCEKMLDVTPDAFLFLYSSQGVSIVPAVAVLGLRVGARRDPAAVYSRSVRTFFEMHFECFVGDRFITSVSADLEEIAERARARKALLLEAKA